MAGFHVENFGCRASRADGEAITSGLLRAGLGAAGDLTSADVVIVNTCSVTAEADRDARAFVRKAKRANPLAKVLVTGCYAQRAAEEVAGLAGVDRVVGNSHKGLVAEIAAGLAGGRLVEERLAQVRLAKERLAGISAPESISDLVSLAELMKTAPLVGDDFAHSEIAGGFAWAADGLSGQTRPNLKVQDGCGNRCSFCVIPQTRGGSRSVPLGRMLEQVRQFVDAGGQEMVLSGINLGRWGRDLEPRANFEGLVEAVLRETGLPRLRISSVEPMDWSERLLELMAESGGASADCAHGPRLARHAHLPLQSGSDEILRAMYRRYRPWHYAAKLEAVAKRIPDAAIGADVMVGFPGETDALFAETYRFVEQMPFTYLHLFPFSARPGTPAFALHREKPVAGAAVKERMAALRAVADAKHRAFCARFVGRRLSAVTLQTDAAEGAQGWTRALSDNFLTVRVRGAMAANRMVGVVVTGADGAGVMADCLEG